MSSVHPSQRDGIGEPAAAFELCLHGLCGCCTASDYPPCDPCLQLHLEHERTVQRFIDDITSIQLRHEQLRGSHPSWDQDIALPQHLSRAAESVLHMYPAEIETSPVDTWYHQQLPTGKRWVLERYPELTWIAWTRGELLATLRDKRPILEQMHPGIPALAWAQILDDVDQQRRAS